MIDISQKLVCYVNEKWRSGGAKQTMRYAERKGLEVINVFREEDSPFFGMTDEEMKAFMEEEFKQLHK